MTNSNKDENEQAEDIANIYDSDYDYKKVNSSVIKLSAVVLTVSAGIAYALYELVLHMAA